MCVRVCVTWRLINIECEIYLNGIVMLLLNYFFTVSLIF